MQHGGSASNAVNVALSLRNNRQGHVPNKISSLDHTMLERLTVSFTMSSHSAFPTFQLLNWSIKNAPRHANLWNTNWAVQELLHYCMCATKAV